MQKSVLNKQGKFGVKILWGYTDMVIFVLRCFILTHPVESVIMSNKAVIRLEMKGPPSGPGFLPTGHFCQT